MEYFTQSRTSSRAPYRLGKTVIDKKADLGIVVDPDVDRLALTCEDGNVFGEKYTLVYDADHILSFKKGNTVSNLSSTKALEMLQKNMGHYLPLQLAKLIYEYDEEKNAVIGGEEMVV